MAVPVLAGIPEDANEYSKGGIKYFLIAKKSDVKITVDEITSTVTDITLASGSGDIKTVLKKYVPTKETAGFTVTATGTRNTGALVYEHQVVMTFNKNDAMKIAEMRKLAKSKTVAICVMFSCGVETAFLVGKEGLEITTGVGQSGVAGGDLNGQTITVACSDCSPEYFITDTLLATLQ